MLTDNAIIIIEGIKVGIEAGKDKLEVVRDMVSQNQWPLFGATAIGVIAFAAIGLSEDATGEYCNSLFWVILISLSLSWISSITITPMLSYLMFKPLSSSASAAERDPYGGFFFRIYRNLLVQALRFRWAVIAAAVALFFVAAYGFTKLDQSFFPPATRPQFMIDVFLPSGTHIRQTEEFASEVQGHIQKEPGVAHVTSFIGGGGLRFLLVYTPESENSAFVQFLVDVEDSRDIDRLLADTQKYIDEKHPNANAVAKKFLLGPNQGGRVQVRFRGPDPAQLRKLADQAKQVFDTDGRAVCVRNDWREPERVIRPAILEQQARRNGITRVDVAQALESSFEGRAVGFYREPGNSGGGVYPQEARLLPIVARPPQDERNDVSAIHSAQIWSPVAGRMIPLSQVTSGAEVVWEDPVIMRMDRFPNADRACRSAHGAPQPTVQSHSFANRTNRTAAGLHDGVGRRVRRLQRCSGRPGAPAALCVGADGVHRGLLVQFGSHHALGVADCAFGANRRDRGADDYRQALRLHGPAGRAEPGGRAN